MPEFERGVAALRMDLETVERNIVDVGGLEETNVDEVIRAEL
jgi:hypothetical protein